MTPTAYSELSALIAGLPASPCQSNPQFKGVLDLAKQDPEGLLRSIAKVEGNSWKSLTLLSLLLRGNYQTQWPIIGLLRCYAALRKGMSEDVRAGKVPEATRLLRDVLDMIHDSYNCLADLIEDSDKPALVHPQGAVITHGALKRSVQQFRLPLHKDDRRIPVVAIAVPNGPLLAATCVSVAAHFSAAPINATVGTDQFRADVEQVKARCILTTPEIADKLKLGDSWVVEAGIDIFYVELSPSDELAITTHDGSPLPSPKISFQPNKGSDICLLLYTSGTSGTKKIVPLTLHHVILGAMLVIDSWGLSQSDICLNMMPLFHIGGLLRNIFAPILAGGSTICCPAFDPGLFWTAVDGIQPTWYYASPTMHNLILSSAPSSHNARFRLICNAAGGLLPSLALQLQDEFKCTVLPSYGMTECMPISTPPLDYNLDRTGTSGVAAGPELAILSSDNNQLPSHVVGRISVRGEAVFYGYLREDGELDRSGFSDDGWFDTGDMGYMDADGYLYVTGRSKEVINRGGEIISPFEVENAIVGAAKQVGSPIFGRVKEALAFSVQHDVLQEVVGVVLVTPPGMPRVDLRVLQDGLKSSLQQAKWPVVMVYMDGLPKRNNKLLRIGLAERMSLATFTDDTPYSERHREASCPPDETTPTRNIVSTACQVDEDAIGAAIRDCLPDEAQLDIHVRHNHEKGTLEAVVAPTAPGPPDCTSPYSQTDWQGTLVPKLVEQLDNYLIPHKMYWLSTPLPRPDNHPTAVDISALEAILGDLRQKGTAKLLNTTEGRVAVKFAEVLQCDPSVVRPEHDFFSLGGDSLKAGRLVAVLRGEFGVAVPIGLIFGNGTTRAITKFIEKKNVENGHAHCAEEDARLAARCEETRSSTRWWLLLLQLFPMMGVYPFRRALQWTFFMVSLSHAQSWPTGTWIVGHLFNLTACIIFAQFLLRLVIPWVGILAKWTIIGRYKEGLYPMWGQYHTRWWMVQKTVGICGYGCFGWSNYTRVLYCRIMGATIGKNVSLSEVKLGEWDLVEIREGAILERCTCRPFGAERNTTMYLGRIVVGRNATVGLASVIAPGTEVPDNTCIGPNSSSWEMEDASDENRDLLATKKPRPHWALTLFGTLPLCALAWFVALLPWLGGLVGLVLTAPHDSENALLGILDWFAAAHRVGFHYLALVLRAALSPFVMFGFVVAVRWSLDMVFGKLGPSPAKGRGQIATWRMDLMNTLMPTSRLTEMTEMMGQHYEGTSAAVRLLGGKVGKRVYWPGTGPTTDDYHLVDIGDDVVFGSRTYLVTSDSIGAEPIVIGNNAMIADRACLLPGVSIGEGTTMGSGALARRSKAYAPGATYVGSKGRDAVCLASSRRAPPPPFPGSPLAKSETWDSGVSTPAARTSLTATTAEEDVLGKDTSWSGSTTSADDLGRVEKEAKMEADAETKASFSPFGRAFYLKQAPYRVLGPLAIFAYSSFITVFTKFYWNVPSISSIQLTNIILRADASHRGAGHWHDALTVLGWTTLFVSILTTLQSLAALLLAIGGKWVLLGRRQPGNYDWDRSSYCQRWQVLLGLERLRQGCYRGHGVLGMLTSTHWLVLYFRALGADIGRDCALFANGDPDLYITEPDLVTLGDRVAVDDASLVGHVNTRGRFDLNRLAVGDGCVLRSGSRLLSGAEMKSGACLLEHTLVMAGDVVGQGETVQGWPSEVFRGRRVKESVMAGR